ncbi:MAG: tetraacyldisaccharide 4'-kinase [Rickettsiales bacterium]|nr:MAG: tetraacyldisaccharide 4'-kinase [Rickettsiales bacterium]
MIKLLYPKFWSKRGLISFALIPFSWIYQLLGVLRKKFASPIRLSQMVICVGNMSVGGTGKTQITLWLAKVFRKKNIKFVIVTKGYGSSLRGAKLVTPTDCAADVGDESILLQEIAPVIAAKTVHAALPIIRELNPDVVIFDDGMQNPHFIKNLNILVIDSARAAGNWRIFPAGPLRENVNSAINRSDIIIMIGSKPCNDFELVQAVTSSQKTIFNAGMNLTSLHDASKQYYAFTAIGDPERFYRLLAENNLSILGKRSFPDHHNYTPEEIEELKNIAKENDCSLITTKKDYVKISDNNGNGDSGDIICADVALDFENEANLLDKINEKLHKKS